MKTWIVIANASRARCFTRDAAHATLQTLKQFEHPQSRARDADLTSAGLGHGLGAATYAPRLDPKQKEHERFAAELAQHLNAAVAAHECEGLVLIASNPFLGEIKEHLSKQATQAIKNTVSTDLTAFEGRELQERVDAALELR